MGLFQRTCLTDDRAKLIQTHYLFKDTWYACRWRAYGLFGNHLTFGLSLLSMTSLRLEPKEDSCPVLQEQCDRMSPDVWRIR